MNKAALVLGELQESTDYRALDALGGSERFQGFRQTVEVAQIRCFSIYPPDKATPDEIRGLLKPLLPQCTARLAPLKPFIERALAALDG